MTSPQEAVTARYPRPPVTHAEAEWIWRELSVDALRTGAKPEIVRLAVIVALSRCTGARYGDLLRCTVDSFGPEQGSVLVDHGKLRTRLEHPLDDAARLVLRRWFVVREELCAGIEGSTPQALLLTVHHTHDNGITVVAGLPITRQGLVLSWRRFIHRTNARYAGLRPPLPTRFEQVRRAWWASDEPQTTDEPVIPADLG
ncbi:Phage integrase family protein [Sanguibacter gelidistatuariae]|uniref:Phage integrase family protein n=1 Tax=Sanguibacter gelidistatuariae TaxID=1814289 RepID=A0A1G6JC98_9MICO|nr:Phage integrase family protein [Sanguibacter gelidistatuariae]